MKLNITNKSGQKVQAPRQSPSKKPVKLGGAGSNKDLRTTGK